MDYTFKPLIMVCIGLYFVLNTKIPDKKIFRYLMAAFAFSWLGDILLMFPHINDLFFIFGLLAFLGAQIFYISLFLRMIKMSGKKSLLKRQPFWLIIFIAYGLTVYTILFNELDIVLQIGVFVYMVALLTMSSMTLNRLGNSHPASFKLVFIGSLFFVISDTLIAFNRFLVEIPQEGIIIMGTYMIAQYLIMQGVLFELKTKA